uniref:Uncharacterized protein n=1 Tax=Kryptolebias marmoratus TaxID=37003 RepID=A0A3Q2ZQE9_KRYMA
MEKVQQSNEACQRGDFQEAVRLYSEALRADPQNCILYSNRSAARLKLGQHQAALEDAERACELNPKWPKVRAHSRFKLWARRHNKFIQRGVAAPSSSEQRAAHPPEAPQPARKGTPCLICQLFAL